MDLRLQSLSRLFCAICLLAASAVAAAADVRVSIEGLRGELQEAARASLSLSHSKRDATPAQIRRLVNDGKEEIRKALEPFGYYDRAVTGELRPRDGRIEATFRVLLGDPVIVRQSQVRVLGEGARCRASNAPCSVSIRRRAKCWTTRSTSKARAMSRTRSSTRVSYATRPTHHRVEVVRKANTASIDLGGKVARGCVSVPCVFREAQFPPQFLERFVPWETGDYYSPEQLLLFQQKLIDADYFSTVTVLPDLANEKSVEVPIDVTLAPAKRSVYTATAYISTDTGPGVRLAATRRWINRRGHKADVSIDNAQRLQAIATSYRIPLPGRDDRSYNFGATYRDENTATSTSRNTRATANETRQWHGFTRTLGVQYLSGNFDIADEQTSSTLVYAEATLSKKQANDLFFPRRGYSIALGARLAPGAGLGRCEVLTGYGGREVDSRLRQAPARAVARLPRGDGSRRFRPAAAGAALFCGRGPLRARIRLSGDWLDQCGG